MALTLTQTATWTKRIVVLTVVSLVLIIGAKVGFQIYYQYQLAHLPKVLPKPEEKFGVLPKLQFNGDLTSTANFSYSIDTQTGELPTFADSMNVYFIPQAGISLLAPDQAKNLASSLGFANGPQILSTNTYQFSDNSGGSLLIDIPTGNFNFHRHEATPSADLGKGFLQSDDELIAAFKKYLTNHGLLVSDLSQGRAKITFDNGDSKKATSAQLSIWPANFNNYPILTASDSGLVKTTINNIPESDSDPNSHYQDMDYVYWPVDSTTFSSYQIKDTKQALADLRSGKGYIIIEPLKNAVSVTSVYLAYFESDSYSPYLQPVYVFEGPHFQAIVQAVSTE